MAELPTAYAGDLAHVDVLRQLFLHELALSGADSWAHGVDGVALKLRVLRGLKRYDEARKILESLPAADDTIALRENRLIVMERLHEGGEFDRLSRDLDDVLVRGGGRAHRIVVAIARHQAAGGAIRRAEAQLAQLLTDWRTESDDPPDAVAFGWRLQYLLRLGDLRRAREVADDFVQHPDWRVRATVAAFMSRLDRADLALDILRQVTESNPGYPTAWRRYISTLRVVGQFDCAEEAALRACSQVIELPPFASSPGRHPEELSLGDHPLIVVERAQLELARYDGGDSERLRAALELAATAMATAPHCSEAWWIKARALRFRPTPASLAELRALSNAEAAAGDEPVVQVEFAHALADATRWDRAREAYEAVLSAHGRNRDALFGLLTVLARRTAPLPEARAPEPVSMTDPTATNSSAQALREVVHKVLTTLPEDSVMLCLGGERLAQSGHYAMAHELFGAAADLCPPDPTGRPGNEMSAAGTIRAFGWARTFDKVGDENKADPMLVRLAHGLILGDQGYLLKARDLFERLAQDYPASGGRDAAVTATVALSNNLRSIFQHDRAQEVVESMLATAPGPSGLGMRGADLYDELGCIWLDRNNYEAAKAAFAGALRLAPAHVGALRGMIQVHRALGQLEEASRWVEKAARLHAQDASIRMEQAWLFGESGQFGLAHRALDAVTSRDIAQPAALEWRIVYLMREGRQAEARAAADLARRYRPEFPSIAETASTVPLQAGDWVTAVQWAQDSCHRYPGDHRFVIVAASICGLVTKSADHLPRQAGPANVPVTPEIEAFVRTGIAKLLNSAALDERPEAIAARVRFVRRRLSPLSTGSAPADQAAAGIVRAAIRLYRKIKDTVRPTPVTEAPRRRPSIEHLIVRDPTDPLQEFPDYRMELAELALLGRKPEVALAELAALYEAFPWWTRVVIQYAMTLAMVGRLRSARAVADESVRRAEENGDPCPVELLLLRGELSLRANCFQAALDDAQQAVQHGSRQYMTARLFHINCHSALGLVDESYAMATELIARRPISRKARVGLARTLDLVGHGFEAAALMQGTKPLFAHDRPSVVMTSWMMRNAGDAEAAEKYMTEARRLMPASTGVVGELAWTYLERRKKREARDSFASLSADDDEHTRALGLTGLLWCDILFATHSDIENTEFRNRLEASAKTLAEAAGAVSEAHFAASIAFRLLANEDQNTDLRRRHLLAALKEARSATSIDEIAVCHRLVGRILYDLGSVASAKEHLERSIELQPYRGDYAGLGLIYLSQGEHAKAIEIIETGLHKLADSWSADSGYPPTTANQVDLYAALGATCLDIDLRNGVPAHHTKLALRFLRQAVEADQRHPFAVDNLAAALTFTGSSKEAVRILRNAIARIANPRVVTATNGSPARHLELWFDKRDLTALRERLVEVLRTIAARDGMNLLRALEIKRLLKRIREIAPGRANALESMPSQHLTDSARTRRHRRWSQLTIVGLIGLATAGVVWSFDFTDDWGATKMQLTGLAVVMLVALFLVLRLATGIRVKITGVEVDLQLSPSVEMLDLPTRISTHLGFGRLDAARTQWTSIWTSESRLPQLGPTVAPLINGYYSHRDQVLPWRRR